MGYDGEVSQEHLGTQQTASGQAAPRKVIRSPVDPNLP